MMNTQIICVTGRDGAGKSTLIESLAKKMPGYAVASIWDMLENSAFNSPFSSKSEVDTFLCGLSPDSRLLFLAHALKFSIDYALSKKTTGILFNAYYYKYFATELALGANKNLVNSLINAFPKPNQVINLSISPKLALERKKYFSQYECGLSQQPDSDNFLTFQQTTLKHWEIFNKDNWIDLSAENTPEYILATSLKLIKLT